MRLTLVNFSRSVATADAVERGSDGDTTPALVGSSSDDIVMLEAQLERAQLQARIAAAVLDIFILEDRLSAATVLKLLTRCFVQWRVESLYILGRPERGHDL